ncbi:MAG: hypothetical protein ACRDWA_10905 [Acidimicrobiia bacterium]
MRNNGVRWLVAPQPGRQRPIGLLEFTVYLKVRFAESETETLY